MLKANGIITIDLHHRGAHEEVAQLERIAKAGEIGGGDGEPKTGPLYQSQSPRKYRSDSWRKRPHHHKANCGNRSATVYSAPEVLL